MEMLLWLPALLAFTVKEAAVSATTREENLYWPFGNIENAEQGLQYEPNTKVRYNLLGRTFADGKYVVIKIPRLRIEGYEETGCENDWLALYDESQAVNLSAICDPSNRLVPSLGVFCNHREPPGQLSLPGQNVTIEFCSDQVIEDEGFELKWKTVLGPLPAPPPPKPQPPVVVECGGTFTMRADEERVIQSPGFDKARYPPNVRCKWKIVGAGTVFMLESEHFELEDDEGHKCLPDQLTVNVQSEDGPMSFGPYCGRRAPEIFIRPKNAYVVTIEFSSDAKVSWSGFKLIVRTAYPKPSACGMTAYMEGEEDRLNFYTPGYPASNQQKKVCTFTAKKMWHSLYNAFEVHFRTFNLNGDFSTFTISSRGRNDTFAGKMKSNPSIIYSAREPLMLRYETSKFRKIGDRVHVEIRLLKMKSAHCARNEFPCRTGECVQLEKFCDGVRDCKDGFDESNDLCSYGGSVRRKTCGFSDVQPNLDTLPDEHQRVLEAKPHSWPWSAAIIRKGQKWNAPVCYGSLIGHHWVITSASCMETNFNHEAYAVRLGINDLSSGGEETLMEIRKAIRHPKFKRADGNRPAENDLMLLKLDGEVNFTKEAMPVCLPHTKFQLPDNVYCMALGWMDAEHDGRRALTQEVLTTVNATECVHAYRWKGAVESILCTHGYDPIRDCFMNTGSPLMCKNYKGLWFLHGVTSKPRCPSFLPAVHGRVITFLKFIYDTVMMHDQ